MNAYTELLAYIYKLGQEDVFVNTCTQGSFEEVDLSKKNIFPILHTKIGNASFPSDSIIRFDVQIGVFDIRNISKKIITDKFWKQDNEVDNLNETLYSLNRIWQLMSKNFEENNIIASDNPSCEQFEESNKNLLDGWILTFQVDVPNVTISLCQ